MINETGRPMKYSKEELLSILEDYKKKHPKEKIKLSKLEKETGIKRHIWRDNMKENIDCFNEVINEEHIPKTTSLYLPSVDDMMKSYDNPNQIRKLLQNQQDIILELYKYKNQDSIIEDLKKVHMLENKHNELLIEDLTKKIQSQQDIINNYILYSTDKDKRDEEGIKENMIYLTEDMLKKYDAMFDELMK